MSPEIARNRYGSVAIAVHWLLALAISGMFVLGFLSAAAGDPAQKAAFLRLHVPLGALTLLLTIFLIVWLWVKRRPQTLPELPRWQAIAARFVHFALYGLIVAIGFSGIGLMLLSGAPEILFFGSSKALPDFQTYPPMMVHATGAFVLLGLIGLHVAAAAHHQFVRRDHLLYRMGLGSDRRKSEPRQAHPNSKLRVS